MISGRSGWSTLEVGASLRRRQQPRRKNTNHETPTSAVRCSRPDAELVSIGPRRLRAVLPRTFVLQRNGADSRGGGTKAPGVRAAASDLSRGGLRGLVQQGAGGIAAALERPAIASGPGLGQ